MILKGYNYTDFSAPSIVIFFAPFLVPAILYGCQSRRSKELELILLLLGNSICFVHGANAARSWLIEIGATIYGMPNVAVFLYVVVFSLLCFVAIIKNAMNKEDLK